MYAELLTFTNDEQRESCIRESFPNENHLRTALLALIELLDPNIDTRDPVIRDGDIDSLIKVVLFEERQRYEQGRNVARQSMSSIPAAGPVGLRRAAAHQEWLISQHRDRGRRRRDREASVVIRSSGSCGRTAGLRGRGTRFR